MRTLPITATDDEIRALVVEWSELLAQRKFLEALELLFPENEDEWTPQYLEETIAGYGVPESEPYSDSLLSLLAHHGVQRFEITSLAEHPERDEILSRMDVDRENLYGLDPQKYLGMVHYEYVPLSGFCSDLTGRFHIKRVGEHHLTLEFVDIHVM